MKRGTLDQQDRFRKLASLCAILATPGFIWCGIDHFCMDGHMGHPPYAIWEKPSDVVYILFLGAGAAFAARSNMRARGWMATISLLMIFPGFFWGQGVSTSLLFLHSG